MEGHFKLRLGKWYWHCTKDGTTKWIVCWLPPRNFLKARCCICVFTRSYINNSERRCLLRIGTLLHEMVHAFLRIYRTPTIPHKEFLLTGWTGHASAWQEAAHAVEVASKDPGLLDLRLDLSRKRSFIYELGISGVKGSRSASKWGFDADLMVDYLTVRQKAHDEAIRLQEITTEVFRQVHVYSSGFVS